MDSIANGDPAAHSFGLLASLDLIATASAQLLQPSPEVERLLPTVLETAKVLVAADAYAVWEQSPSGTWRIIASSGLSDQYIANTIPGSKIAVPAEPMFISEAGESEAVAHRRDLYANEGEGIRGLMVVPLTTGQRPFGSLAFYYRSHHQFTGEEKAVAAALSNLTAAALSTARLSQEKERDRLRMEFLAEASAVLGSSLDYTTTLRTVTRLAVPHIADWCAVDVVEDGKLKRLAIAHLDPAKLALSAEYRRRFPDKNSETGVAKVIRTGETVYAQCVGRDELARIAESKEHLELLVGLEIHSVVIVPLRTPTQILGALTLVSSEKGLTEADVKLAEDLGRRSAAAIENAQLFRALEESEHKFRVVSDTVPCAIYINDGKRLLYVNETAVQLSGYTREELSNMSMFELVHPEDRTMVKNRAASRLEGACPPARYEFRGVRKDGSMVWLDFAGSLVDYEGRRALLATAFDITERKQAEERIQRSELEARTLLNNLPDVIARYGRNLRYRYISPSVEKLTGIPAEQFIGRTHAELGFPPDVCTLFDNSVRKILETGKPDTIEFTLEKEGQRVYGLGLGIPQFGPDGSVESVLTISRDLTEYRRATETLRRNEKELRLVTDSLPALVAYIDRNERFLRVNRTFEQWFGEPQESFAGRTLREVMGEENYSHIRENVARALRGEPVQYEATNRYHDKERHVLIAYVPDLDEQHRVRGFAAMVQDLTEWRQAQRALEETEQRLRTFAEAGPAILYSCLENGYCEYATQRLSEYTGMALPDLLGCGWFKAIHSEEVGHVRENWRRATESGDRHEDEFRLRRFDGNYRWFRSWNVPVRDESGALQRWFGTMMDIEDQKQAEETLRKSEKLAAVGRLAASISHEINNPLESVTNLVFLARNEPDLPERARGFLSTAERELSRVSQIATQTLRFYRQSTGPTRTNIGESIDSVLSIYEGRLSHRHIDLVRKYSHEEEPVYAFEGELRQVLANLIGNAIDATGPGGRIIIRACRCRRWSTGERGTRITVADTGHGIGTELKQRIFEPFFTTKKATGTGLGLWVTREIIDKHEGYIRVRSSTRAGRSGTVFMMFLPELRAKLPATTSV
jgi:PAS domain S-box-containing protein